MSDVDPVEDCDNGLEAESDDFDFSRGDRVVVRVRENGTSGDIRGKFEGTVEHFYTRPGPSSDQAVIEPPWQTMSDPMFAPYEAEFEVVDDDE